MDTFLKFDISLLAIFLLLAVFFTIKSKKDTVSSSAKIFQKLIWINIYMLIMEIASWQFDQKPGMFNWYANYISNMIFAWSTPLITCMWSAYIDYHMFKSIERLKKRWFYFQPMIINTIFIIINLFTPFIFSVDKNNVYTREPFMWLIVVLNTIILIYMWYLAYTNKERINREIILAMLIFVLIPSIAAVIQVLVYGAFILWPIMSVTIVVAYIFLETISTSKDYLTGLLCRHRVDDYIDYYINTRKNFGLIIIDLDDFKSINDQYGHIHGDKALKIFSKVLSYVFRNAKLIGRYAGDEFIIVTDVIDENDIKLYSVELNKQLNKELIITNVPYKIRFSIGYHNWNSDDNLDYETLINLTDKNMYKNKELNKG